MPEALPADHLAAMKVRERITALVTFRLDQITGREEALRAALIELPSRRISAQPVRMTQDDVTGLFFRVVVLLPLAVTFLGFAVWWNRRS
jgi:hypothetical protein